jgi:predicted aspartyl protease
MIQTRPAHHVSLSRLAASLALAWAPAVFADPLPAGCDRGEQGRMPVTFTEDLRPVGKASINGEAVPVMLSTGAAESVVLNKKTLARLGIPVRSSRGFMAAEDARNPTGQDIVRDGVEHAVLKEFSFGRVKSRDVAYMAEDFMDDSFGVRLGARSLLQTDLEIALDDGYLAFFKPQGCFREHLAYWDREAVAVSAKGDPWQRDPRLVFSVRIGGKEAWALLSTATPYSYLPKALAGRLGLTPESPGATREDPLPGHDAGNPVWKVPVARMAIGALEVNKLDLRVMDLPYEGEILVLGADFLLRHRVYIARDQKLIYFSPVKQPQVLKRGSVKVIPQSLNGGG